MSAMRDDDTGDEAALALALASTSTLMLTLALTLAVVLVLVLMRVLILILALVLALDGERRSVWVGRRRRMVCRAAHRGGRMRRLTCSLFLSPLTAFP